MTPNELKGSLIFIWSHGVEDLSQPKFSGQFTKEKVNLYHNKNKRQMTK